jgi:hypothetical protein
MLTAVILAQRVPKVGGSPKNVSEADNGIPAQIQVLNAKFYHAVLE